MTGSVTTPETPAFHASEVPFVFGTLDRTPPAWPKAPSTPGERRLSEAMVGYWASFERPAAPQASGQPASPAFGSPGGFMAFTDAPHAPSRPSPEAYALHEAVVCRRRASGDQAWNWNVGLASPRLPPPAPSCEGAQVSP